MVYSICEIQAATKDATHCAILVYEQGCYYATFRLRGGWHEPPKVERQLVLASAVFKPTRSLAEMGRRMAGQSGASVNGRKRTGITSRDGNRARPRRARMDEMRASWCGRSGHASLMVHSVGSPQGTAGHTHAGRQSNSHSHASPLGFVVVDSRPDVPDAEDGALKCRNVVLFTTVWTVVRLDNRDRCERDALIFGYSCSPFHVLLPLGGCSGRPAWDFAYAVATLESVYGTSATSWECIAVVQIHVICRRAQAYRTFGSIFEVVDEIL